MFVLAGMNVEFVRNADTSKEPEDALVITDHTILQVATECPGVCGAVIMNTEPLNYTHWPTGNLRHDFLPRIRMVFEYTPAHTLKWREIGIPSLFFPTVWHPPVPLARPLVPERPPVPGCHVTSTKFPRRETLAGDLKERGATVYAGYVSPGHPTQDMLDTCPLGVQIRKSIFAGACEIHRMQGWANFRPDIAWVSETGLDDDLWKQVFPNAVFCDTNDVVNTAMRILQDPEELRGLCEKGREVYEVWRADWERGGLGLPKVLYDAIPWFTKVSVSREST